MTDIIRAKCECTKYGTIVAKKAHRLEFTRKWSTMTWIMFVIMLLMFNIFWIGAVIAYNWNSITSDTWTCTNCGRKVEAKKLEP